MSTVAGTDHSVAATGVLLGISVGTVLGLFFAEQLAGLDQLPRTH